MPDFDDTATALHAVLLFNGSLTCRVKAGIR